MSNKDLITCSLFAAISSILAQISIPFPGRAPLTMQTLGVSLISMILWLRNDLFHDVYACYLELWYLELYSKLLCSHNTVFTYY